MGSSRTPGESSAVAVGDEIGIRASSPRPSAFLCMFQNLLCQLSVAFCAGAIRVVEHDGFPERRSLAEPDISRYHSTIYTIGEETAGLLRDLLRALEARVVHGEQHAFDPERWVEMVLHATEGSHELRQPLESQVLALERNDHRVSGREGVDRQQAQRGRAVDEGVLVLVSEGRQASAETRFPPLDSDKLDLGPGETLPSGNEI